MTLKSEHDLDVAIQIRMLAGEEFNWRKTINDETHKSETVKLMSGLRGNHNTKGMAV